MRESSQRLSKLELRHVGAEHTWAEDSFYLVDELLSHQVCEASHAQDLAFLVAGDALQNLIVLELVEHVSDADGVDVNVGITAHTHPSKETEAFVSVLPSKCVFHKCK